MLVVSGLTLLLLSALLLEAILVRSWMRSVPTRIHVGGTRGKSGVTRYVAAALRHHGHRVLAKITGVRPTIFGPEGTEQVIQRRGPARVQEQLRMLRLAHRLRCDAVVLECMSVAPALQELESRLLRPTVSVLTNIRDDHREEYGPSPEGLIGGPCAFVPRNGLLISGENVHERAVRVHSERLGTRVLYPTPADTAVAALLPKEVQQENAALALAVCRELGIPEADAIAGIAESARASEQELVQLSAGAGVIRFLNGFAVNDVPSAERFLERWRAELGGWSTMTILLNTRPDRPYRSIQFARWCATLAEIHHIVLLGRHAPRARRELLQARMDGGKVTIWTRREIADPRTHLAALGMGPGGIVVGLGNIAGDGFRILEGLRT